MRRALPVFLVLALAGITLFIALRSRTADAARVGVVELSSKEAPVLQPPERAALETPVEALPEPEPIAETKSEEAARVEAPVAAPEWVQEILRSTPESWKESHKGKTYDERQAEKVKINDYINEQSYDELMRRGERKEWELIAPAEPDGSQVHRPAKEDENLIYAVFMPVKDGVYKVVLPREEFPDLYTLKDRANALDSMR